MWKLSQKATEGFFGIWKEESIWKEYYYFLTYQNEKNNFSVKEK